MPNRPIKKPRNLPKRIVLKMTDARRVASLNAIRHPGDFCIFPRGTVKDDDDRDREVFEMAFLLPAHEKPSSILLLKARNVVRDPQPADHVWNWDGNEERPTVNPLFTSEDGKRLWKGYMLHGQFIAV